VKRGHHVSAAFVAGTQGEYAIPLPDGINPIPLPGWWSRNFGQATLSRIGGYLPSESALNGYWNRIQEALSWRAFRWHTRRFQRRIEHDFVHRWQEFDAVYVHGRPFLAKNVASFRPTVLMLPGPLTPDLEPVLRSIQAVCAHDDGYARVRAFLGDHVLELPLGINSHLFTPGPTPVRKNLGWTTKDVVIGYVGRLTHLKGIDLLTAAFEEISNTFPNIKILIVGSGEMEIHLRTALSKFSENKIMHIEPALPQEELAPWYRAMNLMVMPSRYETMSSAVLEAMSCGVPFLASDVGGNKKLGESGGGWMFKSGSASSLSKALFSILADPSEMRVRGAIGPEIVRVRHSWTASAERLEFILKSRLGLN
jgi:glycosyltransferase involved in cell wall biosynthesis